MNTYTEKNREVKNQSSTNRKSQMQGSSESTFQFVDNRPEAIAQRKLQKSIDSSAKAGQAAQLYAVANNIPPQQAIQREENLEEEPLQGKFRSVASFGSQEVAQRVDSDDEDDDVEEEDTDEDRETWIEWSKNLTYPRGYTCWPGWHINWTLGTGNEYHVTDESGEKSHYFFTLNGGLPISSKGGKGKGKNAYGYDELPKRVRKFIETGWKNMFKK